MDIIPQPGIVKLQAYQSMAGIFAETTSIGGLDDRALLYFLLSQETVTDDKHIVGIQPKRDTIRAKFVIFGMICAPQTSNC